MDNSMLSDAAEHADYSAVKALLEAGADPEGSPDDFSPLYRAILHRDRDEDRLAIVEALLDAGADPARVVASGSNLLVAVRRHRNDVVRLLLRRNCPLGPARSGSQIDGADELIEVAQAVGNLEIIPLLSSYRSERAAQ